MPGGPGSVKADQPGTVRHDPPERAPSPAVAELGPGMPAAFGV
jgi:hypothetical protein